MAVLLALPLLAVGLTVLYIVAYLVRNIYFHPLSRFPGPKFWVSCQILAARRLIQGLFWQDLVDLHRKVFRNPEFYPKAYNGSPTILSSDGADHSRYRRVLNHAFSERALRDQEDLVICYVKMLVQRLHEKATPRTTATSKRPSTDFTKWYNWTTFDVIGDLTYAESFGMLQNSAYHPWVKFIFASSKVNVFFKARERVEAPFNRIIDWFIPKGLSEKRKNNFAITKGRVSARLEKNSHRPDFMSYILRQSSGEKGLSFDEIVANATVLMLAGSETSSTVLTGVTYHLLKNPAKLERVVREIREAFPSEEDIRAESMQKLEYLRAVIKEGMRIYRPVPSGLVRTAPEGGQNVAGHFIPEGTAIWVPYLASYRYPPHWTSPDEFIPERWLDEDPRFAGDQKGMVQPFSVGPQDCIGKNLANMEIRLIMCHVFWNFDLELSSENLNWTEGQKIYSFWEKPPLMVTVRERSS